MKKRIKLLLLSASLLFMGADRAIAQVANPYQLTVCAEFDASSNIRMDCLAAYAFYETTIPDEHVTKIYVDQLVLGDVVMNDVPHDEGIKRTVSPGQYVTVIHAFRLNGVLWVHVRANGRYGFVRVS